MVNILGVIAARGGSKGLPRKNILPLAGIPLIAHSIKAAADSKLMDRLIVSTDDEEIAETARKYGAEVPFIRPAELALDDTLAFPVLIHAFQWMEEHKDYQADYVMLLQPTSPLRTAEDIDTAIDICLTQEADSVVSMCPIKHHPYWTKAVSDDGRIEDFITKDKPLEVAYSRRQDLPPVYAINGAIYLSKPQILLKRKSFFTERSYAYIMPQSRSIDIDSISDLKFAELVLKDGDTS